VAVERDGVWGKAIEVPGLGALNLGGFAQVSSLSCASAGSCAAGGVYTLSDGFSSQAFVVVERNGVWGKAIDVPGLAALDTGRGSDVTSVSCASAGNCVAGGGYSTGTKGQGFVAVERNGRWGKAIEVPGLGALNTGGGAGVSSVSCALAGDCSAVGGYDSRRHPNTQGFVVSQTG
jgi:hypothetical protein